MALSEEDEAIFIFLFWHPKIILHKKSNKLRDFCQFPYFRYTLIDAIWKIKRRQTKIKTLSLRNYVFILPLSGWLIIKKSIVRYSTDMKPRTFMRSYPSTINCLTGTCGKWTLSFDVSKLKTTKNKSATSHLRKK